MALRLRGDLPFLKQIVAFDMPDTDSLRNSGSTFVQLVGCTHHSLLFHISSFEHNWERFSCFAWAKEMAVSGLEVHGLPHEGVVQQEFVGATSPPRGTCEAWRAALDLSTSTAHSRRTKLK
jgi:hypothetical protein